MIDIPSDQPLRTAVGGGTDLPVLHQFYFVTEHRERLLNIPLCRGFALEPEVNPDINRNCPELANRADWTLLVEFGGMLPVL